MEYFVYILGNRTKNWFYKGITSNLTKRIDFHLRGYNKSTKAYLPLELVHVELAETRAKARNLERFFKSGFGREIIKEIWSHRLEA